MIVPDVNVLVYAFREESARHAVYARWLSGVISGNDEIGLCAESLAGFVRVVTNPRILRPPAPTGVAMAFAGRVIGARRSTWLAASAGAWSLFTELTDRDPGIFGGEVPDAYLAALCLVNGARLATADRGFARYPGLRWFDPAER